MNRRLRRVGGITRVGHSTEFHKMPTSALCPPVPAALPGLSALSALSASASPPEQRLSQESRASKKCSKNHFLTIYRPFTTIYPARPIGDSPAKSGFAPFPASAAPITNGEN